MTYENQKWGRGEQCGWRTPCARAPHLLRKLLHKGLSPAASARAPPRPWGRSARLSESESRAPAIRTLLSASDPRQKDAGSWKRWKLDLAVSVEHRFLERITPPAIPDVDVCLTLDQKLHHRQVPLGRRKVHSAALVVVGGVGVRACIHQLPPHNKSD
eukprot:2661972-Rhodomonas_salina.2